MPNIANISAPVCLVGPGRSGTTLVTNIFRRHPECQSLGETANLIFSAYYHIEKALPLCGPRAHDLSVEDAALLSIYSMLFKLYPSARKFWFQKPIFTPAVQTFFQDESEFGTWYWSRSAALFPDARYFTVLRDPNEVAKSAMTRWGWEVRAVNRNLLRTYRLLAHPDSRVSFAIDFDELTNDPEATTRRLLEFAQMPFRKRCLSAFDQQHAPNDRAARQGIEGRHNGAKIVNEEVLNQYRRLKERWSSPRGTDIHLQPRPFPEARS
jgi:hypothetical protein